MVDEAEGGVVGEDGGIAFLEGVFEDWLLNTRQLWRLFRHSRIRIHILLMFLLEDTIGEIPLYCFFSCHNRCWFLLKNRIWARFLLSRLGSLRRGYHPLPVELGDLHYGHYYILR